MLLYFHRKTASIEEAVMITGSRKISIVKTASRIKRKIVCSTTGQIETSSLARVYKADDYVNFQRLNEEFEKTMLDKTITDLKADGQQKLFTIKKLPTHREIQAALAGMFGKEVRHHG
jgi:hypothetical protein